MGWTPLRIAEDYRVGNFKPFAETIAALHQVMLAAGVTPPDKRTPISAEKIPGSAIFLGRQRKSGSTFARTR